MIELLKEDAGFRIICNLSAAKLLAVCNGNEAIATLTSEMWLRNKQLSDQIKVEVVLYSRIKNRK
jgi:hypothetical protein